jgi:hypothetical protein
VTRASWLPIFPELRALGFLPLKTRDRRKPGRELGIPSSTPIQQDAVVADLTTFTVNLWGFRDAFR